MPPRTQRRRFATRAVSAAVRGASNLVRSAYRAARSYRPSRGMRMAASSAAAGAIGFPAYKAGRKYGRRIYKKYIQGSDPAAAGNELTRFRRTTGKYAPLKPMRLMQLAKCGMTDVIYRFQGLTNFDTNVGFYPLANRIDPALGSLGGWVSSPIHFHELTHFLNISSTVTPSFSLFWNGTSSSAVLSREALTSQTADGTITAPGYLNKETSSGSTLPFASKLFHEWVDIRLNLYGARKRGTTFYIDLVQCKNEFANFSAGSPTNSGYAQIVRELERPLIYSNLNTQNPSILKQLKFVKRFKFYVPGGSADDLDTIGKIKEVKIFHKIGAVRNMAWETSTDPIPHAQADGGKYNNASTPQNQPYPSTRLFLLIRAFSPERRTMVGQSMFTEPADPLTEPSYDIIWRNKVSLPT